MYQASHVPQSFSLFRAMPKRQNAVGLAIITPSVLQLGDPANVVTAAVPYCDDSVFMKSVRVNCGVAVVADGIVNSDERPRPEAVTR